jgi:mannose-6-phosphate isomerase-like protein (cupin superfamily)
MSAIVARNSLSALAADLRQRAAGDPSLPPFIEQLEAVDVTAPRFDAPDAPLDHRTMAYLGPALAAASGDPAVVEATRAAACGVNWYQIFRGGGVDPALAEGMLAGQLVGQTGIIASDSLRAGLFLLAPGIHYPLHSHGAAEIYYCMSGTLTIRHGIGGTPFDLTPGEHSVTPVHRLHSLTTGDKPVLMLYVWIGDVDLPNWWWEQNAAGDWLRANWSRETDGSWFKAHVEPVTEAHMREAHG